MGRMCCETPGAFSELSWSRHRPVPPHKRSLGRRYDVEKKTLALLDAYLVNNHLSGLHELTPVRVDQFLLSRPRSRPRSYNHLRCTIGRLFSYLVDHGTLAETPLRSPPRRARYQRTPFIFDTTAAKRLLALAETLLSKGGTTRSEAVLTSRSSPSCTDWDCA